jgi:hypothetical protein
MSSPAAARPNSEKKAGSVPPKTFDSSPHEEIAKLAYALWQQRGCPDGSAELDWFEAEEQLLRSPGTRREI